MRIIVLAVTFLVFLPPVAAAEVMNLDDGSKLHGRVVSSTDAAVVFEMSSGGTIEVPRARIRSIEYDLPPATTPAPVPAPVPTAAPIARPAPAKNLGVQGRVGVHSYSGAGWSDFDEYRSDFTSAALEAGASVRLHREREFALDLALSAGFYGGEACIPDSSTTCATVSLFNAYADAGPRLEVGRSHVLRRGRIPPVSRGEWAMLRFPS